jgi:hypothetical protein
LTLEWAYSWSISSVAWYRAGSTRWASGFSWIELLCLRMEKEKLSSRLEGMEGRMVVLPEEERREEEPRSMNFPFIIRLINIIA